jgi:hypothetical protein
MREVDIVISDASSRMDRLVVIQRSPASRAPAGRTPASDTPRKLLGRRGAQRSMMIQSIEKSDHELGRRMPTDSRSRPRPHSGAGIRSLQLMAWLSDPGQESG